MALKRKKATGPVWSLSIQVTPVAEEAITEFLAERLGQPVSSFTNLETGWTTVTSWSDQRPKWTAACQEQLDARISLLGPALAKTGSPKPMVRRLGQRDWAESWKRHFKPIRIGKRLLIKPGWSHAKRHKGESVIILDPGLSFGTGQHPTTAFCLEQIVACRRANVDAQSFLDLGTGSGILAIAAAKLGFRPIVAIDNDPQAVQVARENARRNRVDDRIQFACRDLTKLPVRTNAQYSVVCANLLASILLAEQARILSRLAPGGTLMLAGILEVEFHKVRKTYEANNLSMIASQTVKEWQSVAFLKRVG